jgi:hypothetical protein
MKYSLAAIILVLTSCAPTRFVEPIPKDHINVTAALGGPLFDFAETTIPMPLSSVAAGYGFTSSTTLFGGLHTTALLFKDLQLDLGALHEVSKQDGYIPGISLSPMLNLLLALRDGAFRVWPEADVNFYWHYSGLDNLIYVSSTNWFELSGTRANGATQPHHGIANFGLGHRFESEHWQYTTEVKYLALGLANLPNPVGYHGMSGNGAFGVYLALTRKF